MARLLLSIPVRYLLLLLICYKLNAEHDPILSDWRNAFIKCVREESLSPNLMLRNLSLFSISTHDTLNLLTPRYQTYHKHDITPPNPFCIKSAISGCGWNLAKNLHPARLRNFDTLSIKGRSIDGNQTVVESFQFGRKVAKNILESRRGDGASTTISYLARKSPGLWRRTPNFYRPPEQPHWRKVSLWALPNIDKFLPPDPPKPDSLIFRDALREVKELGGIQSQRRTKEQMFIARFWKDFSYSQTPPGHWNEIATFVAKKQNFSLWEEGQLFALINTAMADAGVVAWECKYRHHLWRPIHAIRLADEYDITRKLHNPGWEPLLETPAHPEYVSAHSCYSGAASRILQEILGTDNFRFRARSDQFPNQSRTFRSFSSCIKEISESRLFGGIHYRFSCDAGLVAGQKIGSFVFENSLKNLASLP